MNTKKTVSVSRFGSHASMVTGDEVVQVVALGWPRCTRDVVLHNNGHTYITQRDRLDNGLADPNRYSGNGQNGKS